MILESDPRIGHASSMSSATPAAFLSAMSITTTSASCLSDTPRATVAPTLPAPPTTVTLRFISAPSSRATYHGGRGGRGGSTLPFNLLLRAFLRGFVSSWLHFRACASAVVAILHIRDNRVPELRRAQLRRAVHQTGEIVGDALGGDRAI